MIEYPYDKTWYELLEAWEYEQEMREVPSLI